MSNSIVSVCIFLSAREKLYLIKSTRKDNVFPLSANYSGICFDDLKISGKSKNDLTDLVYDTLKYSLIQREINLEGNSYFATAVLLSSVLDNISVSNPDLKLYPPKSTVLVYFTDISYLEKILINKISDSIQKYNITFFDIIKFLGIRRIVIFLLVIELFNFFLNEKLIKKIITQMDNNIIESIFGN